MQARLSRDPYDALGLTGAASHEQVRSAFLQLTKQFHPAKFARLAVDVQRLANEVFLALRGAHDTLAKPSVTPRPATGQLPVLRPQAPTRPSSPPQNVSASGSGARPPTQAHSTTQAVPITHAPTQPLPRTQPPSGPSAPLRTTPATPASRPPPAAPTQPMRPVARMGTGIPDDPARSRLAQASAPPAQPTTPATTGVNRTPIRPGAPVPATPAVGRAPTRPTNAPAVATSPLAAATAANTDPKLTSIYKLMEKNQFESARMLLEDLVSEKPTPAYKALLHFARGREAMLAHRLDDARVDFMEAMQIVPEHPLAKSAMVEMMTRRK
ncbi:MAG TPA: hypothetical protein VGM90_40490 [Kofleriaceae bacterium]|jgi:hypothetical protein